MVACPMGLAIGATFAGYTILGQVGAGGMGEVYLAQHPRLPRSEALKVLRKDVSAEDGYRQRFLREADLAAALWHPNIVRVNDRGEFDGQLWITMDFVDGTDAATLLRDRYPVGMPADDVVKIIAAIASALDYAHQHELLHRDVKPANIFLTKPQDGDQRILLGDFGIARNIGEISGLTATNMTVGTLSYAAPEQLMGEPIDGRADQYALAATAYHLLTGSPLFPQPNPAAVISHHLTAPPPPLADMRPALAPFDPVLAVALAKDPADRFARCTDFARALAEAAQSAGHVTASAPTVSAHQVDGSPRSSAVPSAKPGVGRQKRRRQDRILLAAATAAVAIITIGAVGYMYWSKPHARVAAGAPKPTPSTAPAASRPAFDGTYRVDYDYSKQTQNGLSSPLTRSDNTSWWAFRSSCTSTGCVATAAKLDNINHQVPMTPATTDVLHFADKHWEDSTPLQQQVQHDQCLSADGKVTAGAETAMMAWMFEPQLDGTFKGILTITVLTNECGFEGTVIQTPLVATRLGDVPPGVTVADPATVIPSTPDGIPPRVFGGPVLDGAFRLDYDNAHQTINGFPVSNPFPNRSVWWAFHSVCTVTACVATGGELADTNHQEPAGVSTVLRFVDHHWQEPESLQPPKQCTGRNGAEIGTVSFLLEPQPDGTLRGFGTSTVLTNECGNQGKVWRSPVVATRMGDVPPSVKLADPALFVAPPAPTAPPRNAGG